MNFEDIMREITNGLTGDHEQDMKYLTAQMEKYRSHEMAQEILRACGRLLYECVPEDKRKEVQRVISNDLSRYESILEEVRFKMHQKKFDEALPLMEGMIRRIEESHMFTDDSVSEYHCFSETFEEVLYRQYHQPDRDLRKVPLPLDEIYSLYGSLLIDLQRTDDARAALATAMRWNPASASIAFEHAETSKIQGDMETFFHLNLAAFKYAFRPEHVARCFRNIGYYFIEKQKWEEATACYTISLQFEKDSASAKSELYYIQQQAGRTIPAPGMHFIKECAEKYGFPVGPDPDVLGLSYAYGKHCAEKGNPDGARYFWSITYHLTDDENIKAMTDRLPAAGS